MLALALGACSDVSNSLSGPSDLQPNLLVLRKFRKLRRWGPQQQSQ